MRRAVRALRKEGEIPQRIEVDCNGNFSIVVERRDTMFGRALAEQDTVGGRFASVTKTRVIGGASDYPTLPASSPWSSNPVPDEPGLGYRIDDHPAVGEAFEIEKNLHETGEEGVVSSPHEASDGPPSMSLAPGDGADAPLAPGRRASRRPLSRKR
jgi:hypothetical protein